MTIPHDNGSLENAVIRCLSATSDPLSVQDISKTLGIDKPIRVHSALTNLRLRSVVQVFHNKRGKTFYKLRKTEIRRNNREGKTTKPPKPPAVVRSTEGPVPDPIDDDILDGEIDLETADALEQWPEDDPARDEQTRDLETPEGFGSKEAIDKFIRDYPKLEYEKEVPLVSQALSGDARARDLIVRHHYWLIRLMVRARLGHSWTPAEDDLINICAYAIYLVTPAFDPSRGVRLSTFFRTIIDHAILQSLSDTNVIRIPRACQRVNARILAAHDRLADTEGRAPTDEEIAEAAGVSELTVRRWRITPVKSIVGSLDELLEVNPDLVPDPEPMERKLEAEYGHDHKRASIRTFGQGKRHRRDEIRSLFGQNDPRRNR